MIYESVKGGTGGRREGVVLPAREDVTHAAQVTDRYVRERRVNREIFPRASFVVARNLIRGKFNRLGFPRDMNFGQLVMVDRNVGLLCLSG